MKKIFTILLGFACFNFYAQVGFQHNVVIDQSYGAVAPNTVQFTDIDGDGFQDILSSAQSKIIWYKNLDGQGHFSSTARTIMFSNSGSQRAYPADIDNDGDIDVVFSSWINNTTYVYVCKNLGNGIFDTPVVVLNNVSDFSFEFQLADLDGDLDPDILYHDDTSMRWLENTDGLGSFTSHRLFIGLASVFVATDLDGDGDNDIILNSSSGLSCYSNDGTATFSLIELIDASTFISQVVPADIDNDNDIDLIGIYENGSTRNIALYENNNGLGIFNNRRTLITITFPATDNAISNSKVFVKDLDNDGLKDIIYAWPSHNKVSWYKNLGNYNYATAQDIAQNTPLVFDVAVGDVNTDGSIDVITSSIGNNTVAWYANVDGLGSFGPENTVSTLANYVNHVAAGDLDGDGDRDIVSSSHADNKLAWYENTNGHGDFSNQQKIITNTLTAAKDAIIADIDNDGDMDIFATSWYEDSSSRDFSKIVWYENTDGHANFALHEVVSNNERILYSRTADVDNDGDIDIVCASDDNRVSLYKNNGNGTFATQQIFSTTTYGYPNALHLDDLDGDGDIDVLISVFGQIVWYENTDGQGTYSLREVLATNVYYNSLFSADIDGDNDKDILFSDYNSSRTGWFENLGNNGSFAAGALFALNVSHPGAIYALDLDNDGDQDIVTSSDEGYKLRWFENDGHAGFGIGNEITSVIQRVNTIATADIDANGTPDLITASYDDDQVAWFTNLGRFSSKITGTVRLDANANGCDSTDAVMPQILVTTQNGQDTFATFTQPDGQYILQAAQGTFTTGVASPLVNYNANPFSYVTVFTDVAHVETADFCIEPIIVFNALEVAIYPLTDARPGFAARYRLVVKNKGTNALSGIVSFVYDGTKLTYVSADSTPGSQALNTLQFSYNNLLAFQSETIDIVFTVGTLSSSVSIGDNLLFTAQVNDVTDDVTPNDNEFLFRQTVVGSYDPNDITVTEGDAVLLEDAGEYLHYIIRFQNTGTASAQRVKITNVLHDNLDWSTIQLETYSHANKVEIENGNQVSFIFNAIYLPASITNEEASHGFIAYKIKPKTTIALGDVITNQANIYFDYNPAIITNTVSTTIVDSVSLVDGFSNTAMQIYPVPADKVLNIKTNEQIINVEIFNDLGQVVLKAGAVNTVDVSGLKAGLYFIRIQDSRGNQTTGKVIKR